ncbi:Arginine--tRNA ligase [Galdieria sulphuraria]|nr:Arginine--tRNA ligase [Galdieria sulphuraria]
MIGGEGRRGYVVIGNWTGALTVVGYFRLSFLFLQKPLVDRSCPAITCINRCGSRPRIFRNILSSLGCRRNPLRGKAQQSFIQRTIRNPIAAIQSDMTTRELLANRVTQALTNLFPDENNWEPQLTAATRPEFGDYQSNAALSLAKKRKMNPLQVAEQIAQHTQMNDICEQPQVAPPGFVNFTLKKQYVAIQLQKMLADPQRLGISPRERKERVLVDFSSPNIAKEMHVGHLRSTIIGDCLCRVLEFLGHQVLRINHVGDWGTQFGMLIAYLKEMKPDALMETSSTSLGDLVEFYKAAKRRFDEDSVFQETARKEVVALQAGDENSIHAWSFLCEQSRKEFQQIYDMLDVKLTERGESFYNEWLGIVCKELEDTGVAVRDEGALCIFVGGHTGRQGKIQPLIVRKSDGGFNYATTDMAAIRYRVKEDKADRILYITDAGQSLHFSQVFEAAKKIGYAKLETKLEHVPFGLVQSEGGKKFKTREGETVKLKDLLQEAVRRAEEDFRNRLQAEGREESEEYIKRVAHVIGIGAIKYADLKNNRTSNYQFSYTKMLSLQGNTAPYMLYAFARIQGIYRKGDLDLSDGQSESIQFILDDPTELSLAKMLLQLEEMLYLLERDLKPNILCDYMFELSQRFNQFYETCPVLKAESLQRKTSRLALCKLTANTLQLCLHLLGIPTLERI